MWLIIGLIALFQLLALYTPLSAFLGLKPLPLFELLTCIALGMSVFVAVELEKVFLRRSSVPDSK